MVYRGEGREMYTKIISPDQTKTAAYCYHGVMLFIEKLKKKKLDAPVVPSQLAMQIGSLSRIHFGRNSFPYYFTAKLTRST